MVLSILRMPVLGVFSLVIFVLLLPVLSWAQSADIEALRSAVNGLEQQLQKALQRIDQLEKEKSATSGKIDQLEQDKSSTVARIGQVEKSIQGVQSAPSAFNPAIGMVLDASIDQKSTVGGDFNFRAAELGFSASVDPFARMYSFMTGSRDGFEVEEAAAITTSLPWNLTAKGGRFFADFGRFSKVHDHELPFVNRPLSMDRVIGESQADGVELAYLFPTPFFLRATVGGYNKVGADNERVDNSKSRSWSRFTYLGRLNTYFDLTDNHSVEVGASMAYTPSIRLSGDPVGGDRTLNGVDLTYRYQPLGSAIYQGVTWGSELFVNSERIPFEDSGATKRRQSIGAYSYAELKLNKSWSTGFLFDYAPSIEKPGLKTIGYSPYVTWNLSEFNRLRFQFTHADDRVRDDKSERGNQVFLQWTTVIGAHSHGFLGR